VEKNVKDSIIPDRYTFTWVTARRRFSITLTAAAKKFFYYPAMVFFLAMTAFAFGKAGTWLLDDYLEKESRQYVKFKDQLAVLDGQSRQIASFNRDIFSTDDRLRVVYGIRPMPPEIREVGIGGPEINPDYHRYFRTEVEERIFRVRELQQKLDRQFILQQASLEEVDRQIKFNQDFYQHRPSIYPTSGRVTSRFGSRVHPIYERSLVHTGIDIACPIGTPIYATADGIATTGISDTYGRYVMVGHGNGFSSFYAHLSKIIIPNGNPIHRGQMLGYVGESGVCTGPHLHYEVRTSHGVANPEMFFLPIDFVVD
jgi:hypothetical protein